MSIVEGKLIDVIYLDFSNAFDKGNKFVVCSVSPTVILT